MSMSAAARAKDALYLNVEKCIYSDIDIDIDIFLFKCTDVFNKQAHS